MKRDRKSVDDRQMNILNTIREKGDISVEELAEKCQVSLMTIRRDLASLDEKGMIRRYHGGATAVDQRGPITPEEETALCRREIARYAAEFIEDGDSLFINGSATALGVLEYTGEKKIKVMTNNARAITMPHANGISLALTGGELREHVMVGDYVMQNLLRLEADKTFIGCAAVYDDGEFSYNIPTEIGINESMIARTKGELFILADHTKIRKRKDLTQQYGSCIYDCPVTLITDEMADPECIDSLRKVLSNVVVISIPRENS